MDVSLTQKVIALRFIIELVHDLVVGPPRENLLSMFWVAKELSIW